MTGGIWRHLWDIKIGSVSLSRVILISNLNKYSMQWKDNRKRSLIKNTLTKAPKKRSSKKW